MGSPPRGQVEQFPITVPFQELIESLHETGHRNRVVLGDVLQVAAPVVLSGPRSVTKIE